MSQTAVLRWGDVVFALKEGSNWVGSSETCDVTLNCPSVSAVHASLVLVASQCWLLDLRGEQRTFLSAGTDADLEVLPVDGCRRLEGSCRLRFGSEECVLETRCLSLGPDPPKTHPPLVDLLIALSRPSKPDETKPPRARQGEDDSSAESDCTAVDEVSEAAPWLAKESTPQFRLSVGITGSADDRSPLPSNRELSVASPGEELGEGGGSPDILAAGTCQGEEEALPNDDARLPFEPKGSGSLRSSDQHIDSRMPKEFVYSYPDDNDVEDVKEQKANKPLRRSDDEEEWSESFDDRVLTSHESKGPSATHQELKHHAKTPTASDSVDMTRAANSKRRTAVSRISKARNRVPSNESSPEVEPATVDSKPDKVREASSEPVPEKAVMDAPGINDKAKALKPRAKRKMDESADISSTQGKKTRAKPKKEAPISHSDDNHTSPASLTVSSHVECSSDRVVIIFTGIERDEEMVRSIGADVTDNPEEATHMVTGAELKRTPKLMVAINAGVKYIVTLQWMVESAAKGMPLPLSLSKNCSFLLRDVAKEKQWGFEMWRTLSKSRGSGQQGVFAGMNILVTPGVLGVKAPKEDEMRAIVTSGGGTLLKPSLTFPREPCYVVSSAEIAPTLSAAFAKKASRDPGRGIYSLEFIFLAVLRQEVRPEEDILRST